MATSSKRQRQLAREKYERQQQRRLEERARRRRRETLVAAVLAVVVVVGGVAFLGAQLSGGDKSSTPQAAASASTSATPTTAAGACAYTKTAAEPAARPVPIPTYDAATAKQPYTATIKTTQGDIAVQARSAQAPCASYNFRYLAQKNFFDKTPCTRLAESPTFGVLQCGDPSGTGGGGPGYSFPDENLTGATYPAGTVAMANSGANTNGSQFFLVFKDTQLPPQYTPWGRITKGLDVLLKVAKGGMVGGQVGNGDGKPKLPVTINDVVIAAG